MFRTVCSIELSFSFFQPNAPVFVTEFWSGWFDHWGEKHHKVKTDVIEKSLRSILSRGASVNFYMFHGELYNNNDLLVFCSCLYQRSLKL